MALDGFGGRGDMCMEVEGRERGETRYGRRKRHRSSEGSSPMYVEPRQTQTCANVSSLMKQMAAMYYSKDRKYPEESLKSSSRKPIAYSSLECLVTPLRKPNILDRWAPKEIAVFESAIYIVGKDFYEIHKMMGTKSTNEIVEFYYLWKKTKNYKIWKTCSLRPFPGITDERRAKWDSIQEKMSSF